MEAVCENVDAFLGRLAMITRQPQPISPMAESEYRRAARIFRWIQTGYKDHVTQQQVTTSLLTNEEKACMRRMLQYEMDVWKGWSRLEKELFGTDLVNKIRERVLHQVPSFAFFAVVQPDEKQEEPTTASKKIGLRTMELCKHLFGYEEWLAMGRTHEEFVEWHDTPPQFVETSDYGLSGAEFDWRSYLHTPEEMSLMRILRAFLQVYTSWEYTNGSGNIQQLPKDPDVIYCSCYRTGALRVKSFETRFQEEPVWCVYYVHLKRPASITEHIQAFDLPDKTIMERDGIPSQYPTEMLRYNYCIRQDEKRWNKHVESWQLGPIETKDNQQEEQILYIGRINPLPGQDGPFSRHRSNLRQVEVWMDPSFAALLSNEYLLYHHILPNLDIFVQRHYGSNGDYIEDEYGFKTQIRAELEKDKKAFEQRLTSNSPNDPLVRRMCQDAGARLIYDWLTNDHYRVRVFRVVAGTQLKTKRARPLSLAYVRKCLAGSVCHKCGQGYHDTGPMVTEPRLSECFAVRDYGYGSQYDESQILFLRRRGEDLEELCDDCTETKRCLGQAFEIGWDEF